MNKSFKSTFQFNKFFYKKISVLTLSEPENIFLKRDLCLEFNLDVCLFAITGRIL